MSELSWMVGHPAGAVCVFSFVPVLATNTCELSAASLRFVDTGRERSFLTHLPRRHSRSSFLSLYKVENLTTVSTHSFSFRLCGFHVSGTIWEELKQGSASHLTFLGFPHTQLFSAARTRPPADAVSGVKTQESPSVGSVLLRASPLPWLLVVYLCLPHSPEGVTKVEVRIKKTSVESPQRSYKNETKHS